MVLADSSCLEIKYLFVLEPLLQTFVSLSLSVCLWFRRQQKSELMRRWTTSRLISILHYRSKVSVKRSHRRVCRCVVVRVWCTRWRVMSARRQRRSCIRSRWRASSSVTCCSTSSRTRPTSLLTTASCGKVGSCIACTHCIAAIYCRRLVCVFVCVCASVWLQKWMNRLSCCLGNGLGWTQGTMRQATARSPLREGAILGVFIRFPLGITAVTNRQTHRPR